MEHMHTIATTTVLLRLFCAFAAGGLVGIEREYRRRSAGFRTHILICIGAAITTLTGEFLVVSQGQYGDISRLGAQVVAGIGFVGAGTIIVTKYNRVKGLTTAAGLWVTAIIGLACGAGYFEGAIAATIFILVAEVFFRKLEFRLRMKSSDAALYIEYEGSRTINKIINFFHARKIQIEDLEIKKIGEHKSNAIVVVKFPKNTDVEQTLHDLEHISDSMYVQKM